MTRRKTIVALVLGIAIAAFLFGIKIYREGTRSALEHQAASQQERLVRPHSPVIGPAGARVTIVEFFDPACETCRAFYPLVKELLQKHPQDLRLVIRYATFHQGSDEVAKLLEAARLQGKYLPALEQVLAAQPEWADHGRPNVPLAYVAAEKAGIDLQRARADMASPSVDAVLRQDVQDLTALKVNKTPTFFVNGRPLVSFGHQQLVELINQELSISKP